MTAQSIALKPSEIRPIIDATFPEYRGPKASVRIQATAEYSAADLCWQDGSKTEVKALRNINGELVVADLNTIPMTSAASFYGVIPPDFMLVEHVIFCGKDLGIRCVVSPDSVFLPKLLPAPVELTDDEVLVLSAHAQLKSGVYRAAAVGRVAGHDEQQFKVLVETLARRGLLSVNKLGASQITLDGKNALAALPSHRQIRL